jgi:hypothetical protein
MDLRPTPLSTYGIGRMCGRSAVGMGRCGQWQAIECSPWRNVQYGDRKVTSSVPSGNLDPFPKPLHEEIKKRCENTCPLTKRTATVTKQNRGTLLAGTRNEGKLGYMGSFPSGFHKAEWLNAARTLNLDRKGPTGTASKRGTRHTGKEAPTLDERNEPGNLGGSVCDDKAPRSANAQTGRRSGHNSFGAV